MKEPKRYSCGNGEGMFENDKNGHWIEYSEHKTIVDTLTKQLRLHIANGGSLPSDDRIVAEAIQAARKVNTEVGLLPNNNDIRMFCLGAKWMRDFAHSNDR